jgi:hypothetical protein
MPKISKISGEEIDQALQNVTRQYLVGDLQKPQTLTLRPRLSHKESHGALLETILERSSFSESDLAKSQRTDGYNL